jgi:hypothetical protein
VKLENGFQHTKLAMSQDKEVRRLMGIVREHAKAVLAKPVAQRESHLAFCRENWKRYAKGMTWRTGECERFAAALDRATRDLITQVEETGGMGAWEDRRLQFDNDPVEGAMESVIVYEAAIEPAEPPAPPSPATEATPKDDTTRSSTVVPPPPPELPPQIDVAEAQAAELADRQAARFGFGISRPKVSAASVEVRIDAELQRKVHAALRSRLQASKPE